MLLYSQVKKVKLTHSPDDLLSRQAFIIGDTYMIAQLFNFFNYKFEIFAGI